MPILTNILITAYCSCKLCCGSHATGIAAIGIKPIQGTTIAANRSIPLGSKVLINKHLYIVQDRYNKHLSNRIDIYFNSHNEAKAFGAKHLTVQLLP